MFYKKEIKELHENEKFLSKGDKLIIEKLIDSGMKPDDIANQNIKWTGCVLLKSEITSYAQKYKDIKKKQKVLKCVIGGLTGSALAIFHNKSAIGNKLSKMHNTCSEIKENFDMDVIKEAHNECFINNN